LKVECDLGTIARLQQVKWDGEMAMSIEERVEDDVAKAKRARSLAKLKADYDRSSRD
jgi:hypothetical protein